MDFMETIEGYLLTKNEDSRNTYATSINAFADFLRREKGVNDKNFIEYLSALKIDTILEALSYYIQKNSIRKRTVAYFYVRTVKKYFYYLSEIKIENENLIRSFAYKDIRSFEAKIKEFIENNSDLEKEVSIDAVDFEDIKLIIASLDERILDSLENEKTLSCTQVKNNPYNDLVCLLGLKLIIFSGIDYAGLRLLKYNCVDRARIKITINSYTLHLPDNLGWQLKSYIDIKESRNIKSENFFVLSNGLALSKKTSPISDTLNEIIGRKDISGIRKYAVTEMIRKGINQSFIMKLTGIGHTMFEDCQNTVNDERHIDTNRYIDSKMRDMVIFDYL